MTLEKIKEDVRMANKVKLLLGPNTVNLETNTLVGLITFRITIRPMGDYSYHLNLFHGPSM